MRWSPLLLIVLAAWQAADAGPPNPEQATEPRTDAMDHGAVQVWAEIPNGTQRLKPGMRAEVVIFPTDRLTERRQAPRAGEGRGAGGLVQAAGAARGDGPQVNGE